MMISSDNKGAWPADNVERRSIDKLIPYARNARTHSPAQVDQIAASIREWGWTVPVLLDEQDGIIAGHGRVLAAKKLGLQEIPCMVARGWSDAQRKAYVLADNKLTLNAGWDNDLLKGALGDLQGMDFDLSLTGFSMDEIGMLMADKTAGLTDPDEAPEPPVDPVSELGDVWLLGNHRLVCGDSTSVESVDKATAGQPADFVFTSPPYAQQRTYKSGEIADWDALMEGVFSALPTKQGAQVLVNLGLVHRENEFIPYWSAWLEWMASAGWRRFGWYVWDQGPGLPGDWNGRLAPSHEFIFHFNRAAQKANKTVESKHAGETLGGGGLRLADGTIKRKTGHGNAIQAHKIHDSVFRVMRHKGGLGKAGKHPAVFPVALATEVSDAYTKAGDTIYEPFSGSGTTIIAGEMTGRSVHAIELSPAYVDVAVTRWQNFTGQLATLEATGQTFTEIKDNGRSPSPRA
jgi:DNA modification methylase